MKKIFLLVIMLTIAVNANVVLSQTKESKKLKIICDVIGFDQLTNLTNVSLVPQTQILIVRVRKVIKGKVSHKFLKIIWQTEQPGNSLADITSDKKRTWKTTLLREPKCDSSFKESNSATLQTKDGTTEKLVRLKDLGGLKEIDEDDILPCYRFKDFEVLN